MAILKAVACNLHVTMKKQKFLNLKFKKNSEKKYVETAISYQNTLNKDSFIKTYFD